MTHEGKPEHQYQAPLSKEGDGSITNEEYQRLLALYECYPPQWLTETIQLGPLLPTDKEALVQYMNDPRIHSKLNIPFIPYKPEHADWFLEQRAKSVFLKDGTPLLYAFRDMERRGQLIGLIECDSVNDDDPDEHCMGFWLSPDYQGRGLMARAAKLLLQDLAIHKIGKRRFNTWVFEGNWPSRRTFEKAGFTCMGTGKEIVKDGVKIRQWRMQMALTDEDIAKRERVEWAKPAAHMTQ